MNPAARDLLQRLMAVAENSPYIDDQQLADETRRWLDAHPEPAADAPAVPDGRELVSKEQVDEWASKLASETRDGDGQDWWIFDLGSIDLHEIGRAHV